MESICEYWTTLSVIVAFAATTIAEIGKVLSPLSQRYLLLGSHVICLLSDGPYDFHREMLEA